MLTKLSKDFSIKKYGLHVRLVRESDAGYILKLRTNKELAKYIHATDNDIQKQLEWIGNYKKREKEGRDYYFIYFKEDKPVGLNRIYNIFEYYGTIGSWINDPDNEIETSMATYFFMLDILFEFLNLDLSVFDVRKTNKHVCKLHKSVGAQCIGETDLDYYYALNKPTYFQKRDKLLTMLNL